MSEPELPCDFSFGGVEMSALVFFGEVYLVGDWEGVAGLVAHGFILDIIVLCFCWDQSSTTAKNQDLPPARDGGLDFGEKLEKNEN